MRFISDAESIDFYNGMGCWPVGWPPRDGYIDVYDTEKRASERIPAGEIVYDDYMGIFKRKSYAGLISMSLKEALLYDYIESMYFNSHKPERSFSDEDVVSIHGTEIDVAGRKCVAVNTNTVRYEPLGINGSVISCGDSADSLEPLKYLYQVIVNVYKRNGICLVNYERIRFYSLVRQSELVIHLKQTSEAKRFFGKMSIDICR